jgi:hypothetical protein
MFNPVGDPGFSGDFIPRADSIPQPVTDNGSGADFLQHDLKAVIQGDFFNGFKHRRIRACDTLFSK